MKLDAQTLFFSMLVNVLLISIALFLGVRGSSRAGIRAWSTSLVLQGMGWASLIAAYAAWPRQFATFGVAAMAASFSLLHIVVCHYLRRPCSRAWVLGVPLVTTVAH
jgi:hypothetical protein